jgi:hypothetical protein
MDRRQLLFGASALGLVTNLNVNHPLIAQVGNAVMGSRRLSDRERAGLRGPVKTCGDLTGSINTDYSPDGRILGYRQGGILDVDVTEFYHGQRKKRAVERVSARPDVTDQFHYDKQGRKTRVRKVSQSSDPLGYRAMLEAKMFESSMFEFAEVIGSFSGGGTVTTRYNENDQPIESLTRNANGELLTKIIHNYKNGRLISETLLIVRLTLVMLRRQTQERFPENEQERESMARRRAFWDQLQGLGMERSYTYDADDRVIRRLSQMGNFKEEESKTYNEQGDEDWTLMIRSGFDKERSEFRYLYQYDSHGNWTERTKINTDQPGDPNTQRRTLAYY